MFLILVRCVRDAAENWDVKGCEEFFASSDAVNADIQQMLKYQNQFSEAIPQIKLMIASRPSGEKDLDGEGISDSMNLFHSMLARMQAGSSRFFGGGMDRPRGIQGKMMFVSWPFN